MYVLGYSGFSHAAASPLVRRPGGIAAAFAHSPGAAGADADDEELPFTLFPLGYFGHDSSAALLRNGDMVACAAEERFVRAKFAVNLAGRPLLPKQAARYCLSAGGISPADVDIVAHYCKFTEPVIERRLGCLRPFLAGDVFAWVERSYRSTFERILSPEATLRQVREVLGAPPKVFMPVRHHAAHAASAFYPSGFDEALVMTLDAYGEVESGTFSLGRRGHLSELEATPLPYSLGIVYLVMTIYLGFRSLGDEYKVMGLAAYGDPGRYRSALGRMFERNEDPSLLLAPGLAEYLLANIGQHRKPDEAVEQRHADVAAALQANLSDTVLSSLRRMRTLTGARNLCMAGGVALNCTMNGEIARSGLFDSIFVQPASGDDGGSVGAAYVAYASSASQESMHVAPWQHTYWGPEYTERDVLTALERHAEKVQWQRHDHIAAVVASALDRGAIIGWFHGRLEFGPRALGNRSILADPRRPEMKEVLNSRVKRRESFRPFAPAVLEEAASEFFDMSGLGTSPYMLFTVPVRPDRRSLIPAVTHDDGTARVQTVSRRVNGRFWDLIKAFGDRTGVPILLNTSFNVRDEPIVCSPDDALTDLVESEIDMVAIGSYLVRRRG
jgi:carbamoyltransferase